MNKTENQKAWLMVLPVFVLVARVYRGMHWPTDVAASVVFTLVWLLLLRATLLPPGEPSGEHRVTSRASPHS